MVIGELAVPDPDFVSQFCDIPSDTLEALKIIEPALYGGSLETVERAHELLRLMQNATLNLGARPAIDAPPSGVAIVHVDSTELYVQSLAVAPGRRGEGVGTALMRSVEQQGRKRQLARIRLRAIGEPAIKFFERLGYLSAPSHENEIVTDFHKPLS